MTRSKGPLVPFRPCLLADAAGGTAVLYALMLPILMGFAGLGIEVSDWYLSRQKMQNASDSAAYAVALYRSSKPGAGEAELEAVAEAAARRSGAQAAAVCVDATLSDGIDPCNDPAQFDETKLPAVVRSGGVRVQVSESKGLLFSSFFLTGDISVVGSSVAGAAEDQVQNCIVALDRTAGAEALSINGAKFSAPSGCGMHSNADIVVSGNNASIAAMAVSSTGDYSGVAPASLTEHAQPYNDPYAFLSMPPGALTCTHNDKVAMVPQGDARLAELPRGFGLRTGGGAAANPYRMTVAKSGGGEPATYDATGRSDRMFVFCGSNSFTENKTFVGPAVYVFHGSFDISQKAVVSGTNVTFVFVDMASANINGNGTLDISAPTRAAVDALPGSKDDAGSPRGIMEEWVGVAVYGERGSVTGTFTWGGNLTAEIDGVIYFPAADLDLQGDVSTGSSGCTRIFARQVLGQGSVSISGNTCADYAVRNTARMRPALYY